ncbi:MAG TPA: Uma2 family endonuclease [Gammaproteobacteria bacterium]|nr:Uma2 family endonuclease [Gammaproteobacteria bacterium]
MSAARPLVVPPDRSTTDHFVYLRVGWKDYEKLLEMRGERSVPRMTYLEGVVELMSPSRYHEVDKKCFARLLEAWSEVAGIQLEGYGSWTLKDEKQDRGAEPDECYTVRRLAVDDEDRPDIAIEVIWTSGGINKLEVYRKLGVREVWIYERESLRFFALRDAETDEPRYVEIPRSERLPELPVEVLLACMQEPSQTAAVRALRAALETSAR